MFSSRGSKPTDNSQTAHASPLLSPTLPSCVSPLLRGGRAFSRTVQGIVLDKSDEFELVKLSSDKHGKHHSNVTSPGCQLRDGYNGTTGPSTATLCKMMEAEDSGGVNGQSKEQVGQFKKALTMSNFLKHNDIQKRHDKNEEDIGDIRKQLDGHESKIAKMDSLLGRVRTERLYHRRTLDKYQKTMGSQEKAINDTILETRAMLQQHTAMLRRQDRIIQNYSKSNFRDMMVNSGYVLAALYVAHTPLVSYTIQLISHRLPGGRKRYKSWLPQLLRILVISQVILVLHKLGSNLNIGRRLWSTFSYITDAIQRASNQLTSFSNVTDICDSALQMDSLNDKNKAAAKIQIKTDTEDCNIGDKDGNLVDEKGQNRKEGGSSIVGEGASVKDKMDEDTMIIETNSDTCEKMENEHSKTERIDKSGGSRGQSETGQKSGKMKNERSKTDRIDKTMSRQRSGNSPRNRSTAGSRIKTSSTMPSIGKDGGRGGGKKRRNAEARRPSMETLVEVDDDKEIYVG